MEEKETLLSLGKTTEDGQTSEVLFFYFLKGKGSSQMKQKNKMEGVDNHTKT